MANDNENRIEDIKLDAFHWHEALDRIDFVVEIFNLVTSNHPVFTSGQQNIELECQVNKVVLELAKLYNKISELDPFSPQ